MSGEGQAARHAPLLELRGLGRAFRRERGRDGEPIRALGGASLALESGEILGVAGESGAGKSTLARLIAQLLEPDEGDILFRGRSIFAPDAGPGLEVRRRIQLIFQDPASALSPRRSVRQSLCEPLQHFRLCASAERERVAAAALTEVGLGPEVMGRLPHQLSSGQKQRVCIARALLAQPDLIVADEPVSALDVSVQAQIMQLLGRLRRDHGLGLLLISHDLAVLRQLADRVAVMLHGRIVEQAPAEDFFSGPAHPYSRELLASVPDPDPQRDRPPPANLAGVRRAPAPQGCVYRHRCPEALERCAVERPAERPAGRDAHRVQCHLYPEV